ncbi:GNAT family N-acetyltransferase [Pseudomonas sp. 10B1]|uniref:GNAT family N-acetyltransferase n=1 Tax=unclassified Pseudomonas TaxID=196821 RepID=UPI002AB35662|nr:MULTISPECIES: GNAT family N-acetyltransferase [unclassified Pseudomonas]MDY7560501.1 GNAT family N-acetyltransferase [Pseudomonas sp. AB6]MEA9975905.1 GNAT family N-acetyltransferase [Pseudomonas sp. RTS4]MEA9993258.1 GNAT family N-acetyltransferase [Pseudomonas sp. AA4]MEB0088129.1 GNAT family N-acetyltransferase [Pseudomonas sp. RTI1]MEB0124255.1 GNAT family N-acetyltransferase [Pseudomonas sp. CCC1.2]
MTTQWIEMNAEQFRGYAAHSSAGYANDIQLTYKQPPDLTPLQQSCLMDTLLPQGVNTPNHYLFTLHSTEGEAIGVLWFGTHMEYGAKTLFIYDLEIYPRAQRRGHATEVMSMLECWARTNDVDCLELNVFAHNKAAQALYHSCGLIPYEITMGKQLD